MFVLLNRMTMNKIRPIILTVAVVLSGLLAYGLWTLPAPAGSDSEGFSAERVIQDIEVISKEHHSVAHPEERAKVREYLIGRLKGLGADKVDVYRYDSLVGPKNKHVVYTFDAHNILAEFSPQDATDDTPYLMLVAHYDSRYSQPMPKDTVWSYGAADDGYGIGVILETISHLLKQRSQWSQGVKVLFTDAEEVGMMGMTALWENDPQVFDNVGLMINVEARGPWGPALLFETCPGNEKVMNLYKESAEYHYTYSLTTIVYNFIPNFTDFTVVKDHIPGLNFSTVADINHYHTDLDNFRNVSTKSIQHYGEQILPVALAYVTGTEYSDKNALRAEEDVTNFTIPLLGFFNFSKTGYLIFNIVVFVLFLLVFALEGVRGRLKSLKVFKVSLSVLGLSIAVLAFGELVAYLCSLAAGATFKPFGTIFGVGFDNVAMIVSTVVIFLLTVWIYLILKNRAMRRVSGSMRASAALAAASKYACSVLYGTLALMLLLSAVLVGALGENFMFIVPLTFATGGLILWRLTGWRIWLVAAIALILLHAFSFLYALSMALTIGAYGVVAMFAFCDFMVLIPLADLYLLPNRTK